jgi:hypothetical protein
MNLSVSSSPRFHSGGTDALWDHRLEADATELSHCDLLRPKSDYVSGMKPLFVRAALGLFLGLFLNACETTTDTASDSAIKTGGAVPGEKTADEPMSATAGPGSAGAGVRW